MRRRSGRRSRRLVITNERRRSCDSRASRMIPIPAQLTATIDRRSAIGIIAAGHRQRRCRCRSRCSSAPSPTRAGTPEELRGTAPGNAAKIPSGTGANLRVPRAAQRTVGHRDREDRRTGGTDPAWRNIRAQPTALRARANQTTESIGGIHATQRDQRATQLRPRLLGAAAGEAGARKAGRAATATGHWALGERAAGGLGRLRSRAPGP